MGLQNAQPRFGYDDTDNTIFDYLASRSIKVGGEIETVDGRWDSEKLVHLIKTGQAVEGARLEARNKVEQANQDFADSPVDIFETQRQADLQEQARLDAEAAEHRKRDEALDAQLAADIEQANREEEAAARARQEEATKQAQESAMQPQEAPKAGE